MLPSWLSSRGARVLPAATLILVGIETARMQDLMAIGVAHAAAVTRSAARGQQTAIGCPVPRSVGRGGPLPMPARAVVRDGGGQRRCWRVDRRAARAGARPATPQDGEPPTLRGA